VALGDVEILSPTLLPVAFRELRRDCTHSSTTSPPPPPPASRPRLLPRPPSPLRRVADVAAPLPVTAHRASRTAARRTLPAWAVRRLEPTGGADGALLDCLAAGH
jgi:hypothetical protein